MVNIHHYMILIIKQPEHHPRLLLPRQQHQQPQLPMLNPLRKVLHFALSKSHICEEEISFFYSLSLSKEMMDTRVVNRSSVIFSTYVLDIYISLRVLVFFFSAFPGIFCSPSLFRPCIYTHIRSLKIVENSCWFFCLMKNQSGHPSEITRCMRVRVTISFFFLLVVFMSTILSRNTHTPGDVDVKAKVSHIYFEKTID